MIKMSNVRIFGFEPALRSMRNPMNSWEASDSDISSITYHDGTFRDGEIPVSELVSEALDGRLYSMELIKTLGEKDLKLAKTLTNAGTDHRKFLRMIVVWVDILAPLYWWKQFDTYKVGTVANSCSTMHKIHDKEFELKDYSFDGLGERGMEALEGIVDIMNHYRDLYHKEEDPKVKRLYWDHMIKLNPDSYNQKRTVMVSYEALLNMYHSRRGHKLKEWKAFCLWIEDLYLMDELRFYI